MAYDEALAERIRAHLTKDAGVVCLVGASGVEPDPAEGRLSARRRLARHPVDVIPVVVRERV